MLAALLLAVTWRERGRRGGGSAPYPRKAADLVFEALGSVGTVTL